MSKLVYFEKWTYANEESLKDLKECEFDEFHKDALIKELIKNDYIICGDTHQCPYFRCVPVFSDGYLILSMRVWAEIMGEAYKISKKTNIIPNFYMATLCDIDENIPLYRE